MKYILLFLFSTTIYSCTLTGQITQKQINVFLNDTAVRTGHAGISIYDPATKKYLYNYNADKNFTPSSNVKLFTMYAGMKYLGDSLVGMRFFEDSNNIILYPSGDPTLLHHDFTTQPVIKFLSKTSKKIWKNNSLLKVRAWGTGWNWDDYNDDYMAERSIFPIYGNTVCFSGTKNDINYYPKSNALKLKDFIVSKTFSSNYISSVKRDFFSNQFTVYLDENKNGNIYVPFITSDTLAYNFLSDSIHQVIYSSNLETPLTEGNRFWKKGLIHSIHTDSLLRPMMHRSDNFFAEQTLLMVCKEKLGYLHDKSDEQIIDTLLKTDFKELPTKPRWVDGSGLSRYNLFSPNNFIFLLDKMKNEFGIDRLKAILPTAGQGTLKGYYENAKGFIYAKTGSMSNNVSLSGYLYTKKNKMLLFSVHINGFTGTGKSGRRAIEKMLLQIRENN